MNQATATMSIHTLRSLFGGHNDYYTLVQIRRHALDEDAQPIRFGTGIATRVVMELPNGEQQELSDFAEAALHKAHGTCLGCGEVTHARNFKYNLDGSYNVGACLYPCS